MDYRIIKSPSSQCPQNLIMIAIFGDTASVEAAIHEIQYKFNEAKKGVIR